MKLFQTFGFRSNVDHLLGPLYSSQAKSHVSVSVSLYLRMGKEIGESGLDLLRKSLAKVTYYREYVVYAYVIVFSYVSVTVPALIPRF